MMIRFVTMTFISCDNAHGPGEAGWGGVVGRGGAGRVDGHVRRTTLAGGHRGVPALAPRQVRAGGHGFHLG